MQIGTQYDSLIKRASYPVDFVSIVPEVANKAVNNLESTQIYVIHSLFICKLRDILWSNKITNLYVYTGLLIVVG